MTAGFFLIFCISEYTNKLIEANTKIVIKMSILLSSLPTIINLVNIYTPIIIITLYNVIRNY